MALRFPKEKERLTLWLRELVDECMRSSDDRGMLYQRASQYYYMGSHDTRAAIYNKTKGYVERLSGMLYQPTDVRFNILYDTSQDSDVLERADLVSEKLSADFRQSNSDVKFADAVTWSLINGCHFLKLRPDKEQQTFTIDLIHPQNFGVISETTIGLEHQEAMCHVSYYSISKLQEMLEEAGDKRADEIIEEILRSRQHTKGDEDKGYIHQMVVGGLQPVGSTDSSPSAAGVVNVFPLSSPWRPQMPSSETVKFCEIWFRDADRDCDWTTVQFVYPDVIIFGDNPERADKGRANLSGVPGHHPFIKIQPFHTPGYFWGRSVIADVQMLQDVLNKRLRDLKIMWDRNANAPMSLSGFSSVTDSMYMKIISEGGFISDPNPNATAKPLTEPPPPNYLEELQWLFQLFDEASGFTPVTTGQGESGVRSGVHAQTLVRTSSPRLIAPAATVERQLADVGDLAIRIMQANDAKIYITADAGIHFTLEQMPDGFQVEVDSHSASPIFREDNQQLAIGLARAGAIDAEDLIRLLHPPQTDRLLSRLSERKKQQAKQQQEEKQQDFMRELLGMSPSGGKPGGKGVAKKAGAK